MRILRSASDWEIQMRVIVLPCDGIGPEIVAASIDVLKAADARYKLDVALDYESVGFESLAKFGTTLRPEVLERAKTYDGIVLGTQSHADYPAPEKGGRNVSAGFRVGLDLYANVRPARTRPFLQSNLRAGKSMDLVIMREATEGFYPDRNMARGWAEVMPDPDMALSIRKITRHCSDRIARRAFELAMTRRRKVTAIHKANSFHMTDGLFLEAVRAVGAEFPDVQLDDLLVDASTAHLVRRPESFDVIVATNFYGDILSDLASELSGSLGLAGSIMASDTLCCAQAQHGSAPDLAGKDTANPTSMILSVAMMVRWIGDKHGLVAMQRAGDAMSAAVDLVLSNPATRTPDIGGATGCKAFGAAVAEAVARS
jgi:3-isopropylmalate dehydrogenase